MNLDRLRCEIYSIIEKYDNLPNIKCIRGSMCTEMAEKIVDECVKNNKHIEDFDFEEFFIKLKEEIRLV